MLLSSSDFHSHTFDFIKTAVNGAVEHGLEISTMPPHLSIILSQNSYCDEGHEAQILSCTLPEILQDVEPSTWSWLVKSQMKENTDSIGFMFWCLVENGETGEETIFCMTYYKRTDSYSSYLCSLDFLDKNPVEPFEIVPYLYDDYEQELVVH